MAEQSESPGCPPLDSNPSLNRPVRAICPKHPTCTIGVMPDDHTADRHAQGPDGYPFEELLTLLAVSVDHRLGSDDDEKDAEKMEAA